LNRSIHIKLLLLFSLSILFGHSALGQTTTTPEPTDQYICIDAIGTYSVLGYPESKIDWYVVKTSGTVSVGTITLGTTTDEYKLGKFDYKWSSLPSNYVENTTYTLRLEEVSNLGGCVSSRKELNVHLLAVPEIAVTYSSIAACTDDKAIVTVNMTPAESPFPTIVKYQYRLRHGTTIPEYQFSNQFAEVPASGTAYNVDSRYVVVDGGNNVLYVVRGSFVSTTISVVEEADTTPPTAICQDITVQLNASGNASVTADQIDNGSSDNCGIASMSLSKTDFDCDDISTNLVVPSSNDYSVNIKVWPISVNPDRDPCVSGYSYTVILGYDISFSGSNIPSNLWTLQGTLGCNNSSFDLPNTGGIGTVETALTWRGTPDCATITPEILGCTDVSIIINGNGISNQTIPLSLSSPNTTVLTVVDNSGNTSICSANVIVEDNEKPILSDLSDLNLSDCADNETTQLKTFNIATSTLPGDLTLPSDRYSDNCTGVLDIEYRIDAPGTFYDVAFGADPDGDPSDKTFPEGFSTVSFKVIDKANNESEIKSFTVTVSYKPNPGQIKF
jgi:hypothetical protein